LQENKPKFHTGHSINFAGQIIVLFLSLWGIAYCAWENKQRAAGKRNHRLEGLSEKEAIDLGYRHPDFRYIT
jgi:hypothetical protein